MDDSINAKRIEYLQREISYHSNLINQYESSDGFGEYRKAESHSFMVNFLKQWIEEIKGE